MKKYVYRFFALVITASMLVNLPNIYALASDVTLPFTDVTTDDWFFEEVQYIYEQGIMSGTSNQTFSPNANVTRAMAVQVIYNHAGRPSILNLENNFSDVYPGSWYHDAVVWARFYGIVSGFSDDIFAPFEYITRAHLTIMLNNYANAFGIPLPSVRDSIIFADNMDIHNYAREAIDRFFRAMIINGRSDGSFDPHGNATRAELATMLFGFVTFSENLDDFWDNGGYAVPDYGFFDDEPIIQPEYGIYDDHVVPPYGLPPQDSF